MAMLPLHYQQLAFSVVQDLSNFYRSSRLPEVSKLKSLSDGIKLLFGLPQSSLLIEVAEGERIYKITLLTPDVHKTPFGYFVYLPEQKRFDAYQMENPYSPLMQWKGKKLLFKGYSMFLDKAGIDKVFEKLINIIQ